MAKYCSYETRKVVEAIEDYGLVVPIDHYFDIEIDVGVFWNTHIVKIVEQVMSGGDTDKKLAKVTEQGYDYFKKPIQSMLKTRGGAARTEPINILYMSRAYYNAVTTGFVRADFNMKELAHLCVEIPDMLRDMMDLTQAIRAAGENRSIYYIHGILRRESQSRQGKIREIQDRQGENEDRGWTPDPNFEKVDIIDRRMLLADWQDRLNNLKIQQALNES